MQALKMLYLKLQKQYIKWLATLVCIAVMELECTLAIYISKVNNILVSECVTNSYDSLLMNQIKESIKASLMGSYLLNDLYLLRTPIEGRKE